MPLQYSYPDSNDAITATMIESVSESSDYWIQSEALALDIARDVCREAIGGRGSVTALDAGCGEGRLLPWLATLAGDIEAADPDGARLAQARLAWEAAPSAATTVHFHEQARPPIRDSSCHLVFSSHVLQHISQATQLETFEYWSAVASDTSALALTFSHGWSEHAYTLERVVDGQLEVTAVDQAIFEQHASGAEPTSPDEAASLPIRYVVAADVASELSKFGWKEAVRWEYHVTDRESTPTIMDDLLANASQHGRFRKRGRDILMVFLRSHGE